jgi:hypothetical protein
MTELNQVFDGDLAERVFLIVSVIFAALYACGILLMQWTDAKSSWTVFHGKIALTALFFAVAISAAAGGSGLFNSPSSGAVKNPVSLSISEIQSAVDVESLPEQKLGSFF